MFYVLETGVRDRHDVTGAGRGGHALSTVDHHAREMSPSMPAMLPPIVKSTIAEPYYRSEFFEQVDIPDLENGFEPHRTVRKRTYSANRFFRIL